MILGALILCALTGAINAPAQVKMRPIKLAKSDFRIFDFGTNLTGFFGARVTVRSPARLYFTFDETLTKGDVDFTRLMRANIVAWILAPGTYDLECFEPYVRFLKAMVLEGECEIDGIYLFANMQLRVSG